MATINEKMAREIAKNDGVYTCPDSGESDPQCWAVFKYYNHNFDKEDFAVAYDLRDFIRYAVELKILEVLFAKDRETIDLILKEQEALRGKS